MNLTDFFFVILAICVPAIGVDLVLREVFLSKYINHFLSGVVIRRIEGLLHQRPLLRTCHILEEFFRDPNIAAAASISIVIDID